MSRWKELIRGTAGIFAAVVLAVGGFAAPAKVQASDMDAQAKANIEWKAASNAVPVFEYQKENSLEMYIANREDQEITDIVIEPYIDEEDISKWPFQKDNQDDAVKITRLAKDTASEMVRFTFKERDDVATGNHKIYFVCTYKIDGVEKSGRKAFWVKTTAKPEEKKEDKPLQVHLTDTTKKDDNNLGDDPFGGDGGFSNGEASYSGGGGGGGDSSDGSVPRVIVTGFDTKPKKVKAGSDFTLTVHLKNTSKKTRVKNMLFDLNAPEEGSDEQTTAPAFLPSSGSSSVYLEGMKAKGTADISIKLNAKSDLLQKPYSVELSMKYEDAGGNAVETASSLSIPVKQDARFEFSDFEINPESVAVDDEANVMCNLYNLGRIKLYNVRATFEGDSIEKEEVFIGNVESGATASIDAMLKGTQASEGPAPVTMTMSYENEEGEATTETKELMLEVTEMMDEGMDMGMPMEEEAQGGGFPVVPVVIAVGVIAMIAAAVIILKQRKKRMRKSEEEDFLYELDGSSEDER